MKLEKLEHMLLTAETWAKENHVGQKYAYGEDYFEAHIVPVVETVEFLTRGVSYTQTERYLAKIAAYLHDLVEDTDVTVTEVQKTFGTAMSEIVLNLTKLPSEKKESQWSRATRHPISKVVKKADMLVNLRASLSTNSDRLIEKYTAGLRFISL